MLSVVVYYQWTHNALIERSFANEKYMVLYKYVDGDSQIFFYDTLEESISCASVAEATDGTLTELYIKQPDNSYIYCDWN